MHLQRVDVDDDTLFAETIALSQTRKIMPVRADEVVAGLVVELDTDILRVRGDCETNAERSAEQDRAVTGVQSFLILSCDVSTGRCTAVPLFSKTAVGNQPLENAQKSGWDRDWLKSATYFSRWQHWRMPIEAVVASSEHDPSTAESRRRYAADDRSALDDIKNWEGRNRAVYRSA